MADLKKPRRGQEAATGFTDGNVMTSSIQKDVGDALRIDDIDKLCVSATDTPAIEPPVIPTTPEISKIELRRFRGSKLRSRRFREAFTEADAHAAAMESRWRSRARFKSQPARRISRPRRPTSSRTPKAVMSAEDIEASQSAADGII